MTSEISADNIWDTECMHVVNNDNDRLCGTFPDVPHHLRLNLQLYKLTQKSTIGEEVES